MQRHFKESNDSQRIIFSKMVFAGIDSVDGVTKEVPEALSMPLILDLGHPASNKAYPKQRSGDPTSHWQICPWQPYPPRLNSNVTS